VNAAVAGGTLQQAHGMFLCESVSAAFSNFQHRSSTMAKKAKKKKAKKKK
jgi:hypothetical protein